MTEEKTVKSILSEALNLHTRTVKEYALQVIDWKERFEVIQKQKHKYQEEYRNIKKEVESCTQENNKLKGEIDSLRQFVDRDHRSDKCAACSSFQHTIQTLKDVYENTISQKDSHIKYLESRIKALEKSKSETKIQNSIPTEDTSLFSPDSTSKYSPRKSKQRNAEKGHNSANTNRKLLSPDQEDDIPEKTVHKLKLPSSKKRSRYSEDPSPEQKRLRFDKGVDADTDLQGGDNLDGNHGKSVNKKKQINRPQVIVPETCDFDMDLMDDEDEEEEEETCLEINNETSRNKNQGTSHNLMKNELSGKVPDNVKKNLQSKKLERVEKRGNRSVALESSSSESEEGNASRGQVHVQKIKGLNKSWLHSVLKSPDTLTRHEENIQSGNSKYSPKCSSQSESSKEFKSSLRKTKSDAECLLKKMTTNSGHVFGEDSQEETLLPVVPLKNGKNASRNENSKIKNKSKLEKSVNRSHNSDLLKSPSLFDGNTTSSRRPEEHEENQPQSGHNSQQPIDIQSDNDSPLILRTLSRTNYKKQSFPEVDILFEDSQESPNGKSILQNNKSEKIIRKVRGQRSGFKRSQEKSPDFSSPVLRDRSKIKSNNNILVPVYEIDEDEARQLRQTTLSQAFMNNKPDSELQLAIEQSLKETSKNGDQMRHQANQDLIEAKENSPPFKKPSIPKMKKKKNKSDDNERGLKSKHLPDLELDETIAPSRCKIKGSNCELVQERVNGSLDPAIQLSQLCQDSEDLDTENPLATKKKAVDLHLDTLQDFNWEDLQGNSGIPKTSTCVEFDDDSQGIPCSSTSVKFGSGKLKRQKRKLKTGDTENSEQAVTQNKQIMDDSFDVRPKKADPEYAYVDVVRGKEDRRKLKAFWCEECADYYKDTGLSDEEIQKKMQSCSRHRATFVPPSTPEHFWSIGFMDTPECEERGYINKETSEEKKKPVFKRTRGYKQLFKSKKENEES